MDDLNSASIILNLDLASLCSLGPAKQTSKHLTSLTLVTVNSLLAQQHEVDVFLLDNGAQHLGNGQRLRAAVALIRYIDVECAVSAHGHSCAQDIGGLGSTGGESDDIFNLDGALTLAQADCLFD
jgi:hypothetical protein